MSSKIGIHYLGRGAALSTIQSGMLIGKWVGQAPPVDAALNLTTVFRWVENPDNVNDWMTTKDPNAAAIEWIEKQRSHFQEVPFSTYIEGPNENNCETRQQAEWLGAFELKRMQLTDQENRACCIFNFGTGRPPLPVHDPTGIEVWTALLPALRYAKANDHIMGMHAYNDDPHDQWNMLRYRMVYNWLPEDARCLLVITECAPFNALRFNADQYMEFIRAYDAEMRRDPYVLGCTLFTSGTAGSSAWDSYNIDSIPLLGRLEAYIMSQRTIEDPEPEPQEPPMPTDNLIKCTLEEFNTMDLGQFTVRDQDQGNTLLIPKLVNFDYMQADDRISWINTKEGARDKNGAVVPVGATRIQEYANQKPEAIPQNIYQAADVRGNSGYGTLHKVFKGWGAFRILLYFILTNLQAGKRYRLKWPVFADIVVKYGPKVFADDPSACFVLLGKTPGAVNPGVEHPDSLWYDGSDFVFGAWREFELLFEATGAEMTLDMQFINTFPVVSGGLFWAKPSITLISDTGPVTPPPDPSTQTLKTVALETADELESQATKLRTAANS